MNRTTEDEISKMVQIMNEDFSDDSFVDPNYVEESDTETHSIFFTALFIMVPWNTCVPVALDQNVCWDTSVPLLYSY